MHHSISVEKKTN